MQHLCSVFDNFAQRAPAAKDSMKLLETGKEHGSYHRYGEAIEANESRLKGNTCGIYDLYSTILRNVLLRQKIR